MHNESRRNLNLESVEQDAPEPIKSSKLEKIKSAAIVVGFYGSCAAITGGSMYFGWKLTKMQLDTAKLTLEAAKLKNLADLAPQK
jgi:hypothetical protein